MYNLLIADVQPSQILDALKTQFSKNTGIDISDISNVIVMVDEELVGILDYNVQDSYIKLATGEVISVSERMVYNAINFCMPSIPKQYSIVGLGFGGVDVHAPDNCRDFNLTELVVDVVFSKDPSVTKEDNLISFLHEILRCENCDYGYFWGSGDFGDRLVSRFIELDRIDLLCEAIQTCTNDAHARINAVALSLEHNYLAVLEDGSNKLAHSLFERRDQLTERTVNILSEILSV